MCCSVRPVCIETVFVRCSRCAIQTIKMRRCITHQDFIKWLWHSWRSIDFNFIFHLSFLIVATLYGWIIVFVLPINSALNPILYTISTTSFSQWFHKHVKLRRRGEGRGSLRFKNEFSSMGGTHIYFVYKSSLVSRCN